MKSIWLFLAFVFVSITIHAQNNILKGMITYQNTGAPVNGVKITPTVSGGNHVFSDDAGLFTLKIAQGTPGAVVTLLLQKETYQLVNSNNVMLIEVAIRKDKEDLASIIMVKTNEFTNRKDNYVAAIEKQLKGKEEEVDFLRSQLRNNQISDDERSGLSQQIGQLTKQIKELEKGKGKLAEKLATIDLSQAADFVREAIEKFEKEGNVQAALDILKEEKLEKLYQDGLAQEKAATKAKAQAVEGFMTRARLQIANFNFKAASKNYLEAIEKDSTNVDNLWEVAYYLADLNDQKRAIAFYNQALRHTKSESTKSALLNNLGNQQKYNEQYEKAERTYLDALEIYQRLAKSNPERFEPDVAGTQNNLGNFYSDLNLYEKAEKAYLDALEIRQRLAKSNPERFEPDVATTQNNLGIFYKDLNLYEKAEKAYLDALEIRQRLAKSNPERFEPDVADTQNNLGSFYSDLNQYEKAEKVYLDALEIYQRLAKSNPERFEPDVAMTQNNLGNFYSDLNQYEKAEKVYLDALEIRQRLAKSNPERFEPFVATTQNNLGNFYSDLNQYEKAERAYLDALEIYQRLAKSNPERFEPFVATTQNNLGSFYSDLNQYEKAEIAYLDALEIRQRLAKSNPERFEPFVATTQNNLGSFYSDLNQYEKAEIAYLDALEIRQRLAKSNPERFEPDVAMTQNNLGIFYKDLNQYEKAEIAYLDALEIRQRLAKSNPERFEPDVATTQNNLGLYYYGLNQYEKANRNLENSLVIYQDFAQQNPLKYELEVARTLTIKGLVLLKLKKQKTAINHFLDAQILAKKYPQVPLAQTFLSIIEKELAKLLAPQEQGNPLIDQITQLEKKVENAQDDQTKVNYQEKVVELLEQLRQENPNNAKIDNYAASQYGSLAWFYLFTRQFKEAEQAAQTAIQMSDETEWVNTNLAIALLYQGQLEAAKKIYLKLKDKPYGEATYKKTFLEDLDALAAKNISHKDVAQIRQLLQE